MEPCSFEDGCQHTATIYWAHRPWRQWQYVSSKYWYPYSRLQHNVITPQTIRYKRTHIHRSPNSLLIQCTLAATAIVLLCSELVDQSGEFCSHTLSLAFHQGFTVECVKYELQFSNVWFSKTKHLCSVLFRNAQNVLWLQCHRKNTHYWVVSSVQTSESCCWILQASRLSLHI